MERQIEKGGNGSESLPPFFPLLPYLPYLIPSPPPPSPFTPPLPSPPPSHSFSLPPLSYPSHPYILHLLPFFSIPSTSPPPLFPSPPSPHFPFSPAIFRTLNLLLTLPFIIHPFPPLSPSLPSHYSTSLLSSTIGVARDPFSSLPFKATKKRIREGGCAFFLFPQFMETVRTNFSFFFLLVRANYGRPFLPAFGRAAVVLFYRVNGRRGQSAICALSPLSRVMMKDIAFLSAVLKSKKQETPFYFPSSPAGRKG